MEDSQSSIDTKRSGSYPLQTPDFTPHPELSKDAFAEQGFQKVPRTMRALKNSDDANGHPRTVIIALDGTGDQFDNDNSNIVHFVSCLKKHTPDEQVTYYQSGIGTYDKGGLKNGFGAAMDMAVGSGLGIHVKEAYKFLMQNYKEGDKIILLGFSRGAYTIRCLAGMLNKVGLLPASNISQINFAYNFYKDDSEEGFRMSGDFKKTFCTEVSVYFVGLWDCVASVGFIPRKLPFSKTPTSCIRYFRHAMALDEHRAKFKVCHWRHASDNTSTDPKLKRRATIDNTPMGRIRRSKFVTPFSKKKPPPPGGPTSGVPNTSEFSGKDWAATDWTPNETKGKKKNMKKSEKQRQLEKQFERQELLNREQNTPKPDALEVWFMGGHADIGGGAVDNTERHMLSRIPLRWMIRQCFECDTGILFDPAALAEQGLDVHTLYPKYQQPTRPTVGPPPALLEKKEDETLAPIQMRSTFMNIGEDQQKIDDAPSAEELSYILPSEATEDFFDCEARLNDQLADAKGWWILEVWPVKVRVLCKIFEFWEKKVSINWGRYRPVRELEPKMHWTVQYMIEENKYKLKVRHAKGTTWVPVVSGHPN